MQQGFADRCATLEDVAAAASFGAEMLDEAAGVLRHLKADCDAPLARQSRLTQRVLCELEAVQQNLALSQLREQQLREERDTLQANLQEMQRRRVAAMRESITEMRQQMAASLNDLFHYLKILAEIRMTLNAGETQMLLRPENPIYSSLAASLQQLPDDLPGRTALLYKLIGYSAPTYGALRAQWSRQEGARLPWLHDYVRPPNC